MGKFGEQPISYQEMMKSKKSLCIKSGSEDLLGTGTEIFLQHGTGLDMSQPVGIDYVISNSLDVNAGAQTSGIGTSSVDVLKVDALRIEQLDMRRADEIVRMLGGKIEKNNAELLSNIRGSLEKKRMSPHH